MKVEDSASVCCSCDAVRISVEKGVLGAVAGVAVASKAGLRGPRGDGKSVQMRKCRQRRPRARSRADTPILLLRYT
ncbi:hypothetical protein GCM10020227_13420 [Streptomyces flavovirens]